MINVISVYFQHDDGTRLEVELSRDSVIVNGVLWPREFKFTNSILTMMKDYNRDFMNQQKMTKDKEDKA